MQAVRFKISRWIFLSLSFLTNLFLILYSTLPREITIEWNNFVTNTFSKIVNTFTEKEVKVIPITDLQTAFSNEESHKYNYIPGYEVYEIPLGSAKQIESSYLPADATDTTIQYSAEDSSIVSLNQSGLKVSVVGMKPGSTVIHALNKLSGLEKTCEVKVVETVAPISYEISLNKTEIAIGEQQTIKFDDIDGGNLGHDELINFRYYDTRKLTFFSSKQEVAEIDENGVIYPKKPGNSTITVSNAAYGFSKSINVTIKSGTPAPSYDQLIISGPNVCYDNDMIRDQSSKKNHYQLEIKDKEKPLNPDDFIWESSDELLVKVDRYGVIRGFRKKFLQDEKAVITATSKLTKQSTSFEVTVKEQLPTAMYHSIVNEDQTRWNPSEYTTCVGDNLTFNVAYEPNISNKSISYTVSNQAIEVTNLGSSLNLHVVAEGDCDLTVTSIVNPELSRTVRFTILKAGAISTNDVDDIGTSVRKIVGHASLFAIAEVFTLIAFYMFLYNKKHWFSLVFSLGVELSVSSFSELVQFFTPNRYGSFTDIGINFLGSIVGAGILVAIYFIHRAIVLKKSHKEKENEE